MGPFKCKICGASFSSPPFLRNHLSGATDTNKCGHPCQECGQVFRTTGALSAHIKVHLNGLTGISQDKFQEYLYTRKFVKYKCHACKLGFPTNKSWEQHKEIHKNNLYECPFCKNKFYTWRAFERHIKRRSKTKICGYACPECGNVLLTLNSLRQHIRLSHTLAKPKSPLNHAKPVTVNKQKRSSTKNPTRNPKPVRYFCNGCHRGFTSTLPLNKHKFVCKVLKDLKAGKKPKPIWFNCPLCNQQYDKQIFLTEHIRVTHGIQSRDQHNLNPTKGTGPFTCRRCGKSLKSRPGLQNHYMKCPFINLATRFHCEKCGAHFSSKAGYNSHVRNSCNETTKLRRRSTKQGEKSRKPKANAVVAESSTFTCHRCKETVQIKFRDKHLGRLCKEKPTDFVCKLCNMCITNMVQALAHVYECKEGRGQVVTTNILEKEVSAADYPLQAHYEILLYLVKEEYKLRCEHCTLKLPNGKLLMRHEILCKPPKAEFESVSLQWTYCCGHCYTTTKTQAEMVQHEESEHRVFVRAEILLLTATSLDRIKQMDVSVGGEPKRFCCYICCRRFGNDADAREHASICTHRHGI